MIFDKNNTIIGSEGKKMASDFIFDEEKKNLPILIYTHGFNGFKDWGNFDLIAEKFAEAGFFVVKYNLSHNGTRIEQPEDFCDLEAYRKNTYSKEVFDLQQVIETIFEKDFKYAAKINTSKVNLLGHSRGGAISILAGQDKRIQKIITWASISSCTSPWKNFSAEKMQAWKEQSFFSYENKRTQQQMPIDYSLFLDYIENQKQLDVKTAVSSMKKSMLFIHGRNDDAVHYSASEELHESNKTYSTLLLCEGNHVFGRQHPWLENYLPQESIFIVEESIEFLKYET
ncbi:MAG: hypothetical protein KA275_02490 [Chitinophagaceae bacterium]|nr:hypothetical protein [Chitinophagaceae bacterium]